MGEDLDNSKTSSLSFTSHEKGPLQTLPITHSSTNVEVFVATAGTLANTGQKTATKSSSHLNSHEKGMEIRPNQTLPGTEKNSNANSDETDGNSCIWTHDSRGAQASSGTDVDHPNRGGVNSPDQAQTYTKTNSNAKSDKTDGASYISTLDSKGTQASAETDVDHPRGQAFQESQNTFVTIGMYMYLFSYIFTKSMTPPRSKIRSTTILFCITLSFCQYLLLSKTLNYFIITIE